MAQRGRRRNGDRWEPWAVATGIAFVVHAVIAFVLAGGPDANAAGDETVEYFQDNESAIKWQAFLFSLSPSFFLGFFATLAALVRRDEPDAAGRLGAIIVASAGASAALYLAGLAAWTALAKTSGETGTNRTLFDLGDMALALSNYTAATLVAATSLAILRTRLVQDWVGWLGVAVFALLVVNGAVQIFSDSDFAEALGRISFLAFLVWVLLTSGLLTLRMRADGASTRG